jgi:hypothetical protein
MEPFGQSKWFWLPVSVIPFIVLLMAVLLVLGFYLEEDVRGMLAWQKTKAEIEAHGISLNPKDYIPPPVPDAVNFGALPIFKLSSDPASEKMLEPVALNEALHSVYEDMPVSKNDPLRPDSVPYPGNWTKGEMPDIPAIQKRLLELCQKNFSNKAISPTATPVELFGLLCPILADLRAENDTYPQCRFEHDYASKFPMTIPLGGTISQIKLAKVLAYEERLALMNGDPALALDDLKVAWKIDSGLRKEPMLISGLVASAVQAIQLAVVNEGLAKHVWNDQQLTDLDNDLGKADYLTYTQFVMGGETAFFLVQDSDYFKVHRGKFPDLALDPSSSMRQLIFLLAPNGWFDQYKADGARFQILGTVQMVAPATRRVFPERETAVNRLVTDNNETSYWRDFVLHTQSPVLQSVKNFAFAQAQADEARIACRLERYRLAHGQYPNKLDVLIPAYGTDLPRDIMNGEPYHYRLNPDGTYVLYSVAWNQTDDGGDVGSRHYTYTDSPDWVWANYPHPSANK